MIYIITHWRTRPGKDIDSKLTKTSAFYVHRHLQTFIDMEILQTQTFIGVYSYRHRDFTAFLSADDRLAFAYDQNMKNTCTHIFTYTLTLTDTYTHTHTHTQKKHTHTYTYTLVCKHIDTHTSAIILSMSLTKALFYVRIHLFQCKRVSGPRGSGKIADFLNYSPLGSNSYCWISRLIYYLGE